MKQAYHQKEKVAAPGGKSPARGASPSATTLLMAAIWLSTVVACLGWTLHHAYAPGPVGKIPDRWPTASRVVLDTNRPTLIMFAHPHCPCTRASIGELARLMTDCYGQLSAQVWFVKPSGTGTDWTNTDLWASAAAIPGVTVHCDETGGEAHRFQAETSGQTMLYDRNGQLLFQGGITIARGHEGDNAGKSAIEDLVQNKIAIQVQTTVFGCSLFDEDCQSAAAVSVKP